MTSSAKLIGKYEILDELGRGGFAVVYRARDVKLDRLVALKVLRSALSDDPDFVARFEQEARAVARLKHPHIVTVYDAVQIDGQLIIAMQYVAGHTLQEELRTQRPLPFDRAAEILEQIASALDDAHRHGIVHRDVKPANILLEGTSQGVHATLLDFGLAKALESSMTLTSQGTLLGSPEYMAPEQADPERANEIGPATDRYALGIVAYQLLTGHVPFQGNSPATLNAHLNLKPTDPHTLRSEVSPRVSTVLLKMLAKTPTDRYASAGEFVQALQLAWKWPPPPPPRWWLVALVFLLMLVIGVVGYGVIKQFTSSPTATLGTPTLASTKVPTSALAAGNLQTRTIDGMVMVYVPGGTIMMGTDQGEDNERPAHDVTLDGFWIDRTEVTNAQYARCVAAQQCATPADTQSYTRPYFGNPQFDDYPVIHVTWENATQYCTWAGGQLPTEAQWEYAARGPQGHLYPWGNEPPTDTRLNYRGAFGDTQPVGAYPTGASWVGAFDLAGNVWEWVRDWYAPYSQSSQINPVGPASGERRVLRGGFWRSESLEIRTVFRHFAGPEVHDAGIGFRCTQGKVMTRATDGMTMLYVPGGTFEMGRNPFETPVHSVTLDPFWIDLTEITNAAFQKFVDDTRYQTDAERSGVGWVFDSAKKEWRATQSADWRRPHGPGSNLNGCDDHPVVQVSWNDAHAYCQWAGGRLPTEAEWEYTARSSQSYLYPWGNDQPNDGLLNFDLNLGDVTDAGSYPRDRSWVGALDMAGNVAEWVNDWYTPYPDSSQTNPTSSGSGAEKVLRGGSWYFNADLSRSTIRHHYAPDSHDGNIGFRCVVAVEE